jgi:hypothetical protein
MFRISAALAMALVLSGCDERKPQISEADRAEIATMSDVATALPALQGRLTENFKRGNGDILLVKTGMVYERPAAYHPVPPWKMTCDVMGVTVTILFGNDDIRVVRLTRQQLSNRVCDEILPRLAETLRV